MSKSPKCRFLSHALPTSAAAFLLCSMALAAPAEAGTATLCPSSATVGGFGGTSTDVSGPLDATCGANSAVKIDLPASTDYGKLIFDSSTPGYPAGLTLGSLNSLSADVAFTSSGSDQPYFLLAFTDGSNSVGQANPANQILMIEFQPSTLTGSTLAVDPNTTLFNLYDNTAGAYLQGGQHDTNSLQGWLSLFPSLGSENLDGVWIAEGLTANNVGAESLTVNSLQVGSASAVPEPGTLALFGAGLAGLGGMIRRRRRRAG